MIESNEGISAVSSVVQKSDLLTRSAVGKPLSSSRENKTFPDNVSLPSGNISFAALQTRNDHLNTTATTIRAANKIMDDVAKVIGEKREEIIQYEKQYPPFADQSSEKVEFLNSLTGLKKQVDALTLIPDNTELASIVSDPSSDQFVDSEVQKKSFSEGEKSYFSLRPQEVHSGENGLNIASINSNATDSEIRQFDFDLATANQKLESRKAGLAEDAKTISHEIATTEKSIGKEFLESEQEVSQKTEEIKKGLATLPGESLGNDQSRILLETLE